jgi:serine/threonine protein kinase
VTTRREEPADVRGGAAPLVGGYELLTKIGEGGMGVVHLARREDGERVALKVLRPQVVGDDDGRGRLDREVDSLSRVHSRWVAEIVDADPWAEVPWIATRYVPGLSLHDHVVEEGPLQGADLLWFAGCLAEGLDAVHAAGVLHRDVKPSNVLMEGRTPILIDFGLAKLADDPRMTQAGWLIGTPGYLAPEILHGDDATEASDVHAWAATVAYAGTGRAPFGRGPSAAVMDRVRRGEHDLTGLTGDLARVVAAALDPDPARRPELWEVLDWLRPQTTRVRRRAFVPPPPVAHEPDETHPWQPTASPYDLTALGEEPDAAPGTRVLDLDEGTRHQPVWDDDPAYDPAYPYPRHPGWDEQPAPRVPLLERARRATLVGLLGAAATVLVLAAPLLSVAGLLVVTWLLRSGSLAASTVGARREVRGRRWYDGPRLLLGAPWDLLRSIPSTLVLQLWSLGLALAAGLLCYALALDVRPTLAVTGAVLVGSLWWGPGGSRVRSPLWRCVRPVSATLGAWAFGVGVLALLIGAAAYVAATGTDWTPLDSRPFAVSAVPLLTR